MHPLPAGAFALQAAGEQQHVSAPDHCAELEGLRASAAHQSGPHAPPPNPCAAQLLQHLGATFPGLAAPAFSFHRGPPLELWQPQPQPAASGGCGFCQRLHAPGGLALPMLLIVATAC